METADTEKQTANSPITAKERKLLEHIFPYLHTIEHLPKGTDGLLNTIMPWGEKEEAYKFAVKDNDLFRLTIEPWVEKNNVSEAWETVFPPLVYMPYIKLTKEGYNKLITAISAPSVTPLSLP